MAIFPDNLQRFGWPAPPSAAPMPLGSTGNVFSGLPAMHTMNAPTGAVAPNAPNTMRHTEGKRTPTPFGVLPRGRYA
jgi:hypothetical protein